jgi:hypothetical protein
LAPLIHPHGVVNGGCLALHARCLIPLRTSSYPPIVKWRYTGEAWGAIHV